MRIVTKKLQGDGKMSWIIEEKDKKGNHIKCPEIVFEDPNLIKKINIENIDLETLPPDQLKVLAEKLKPFL